MWRKMFLGLFFVSYVIFPLILHFCILINFILHRLLFIFSPSYIIRSAFVLDFSVKNGKPCQVTFRFKVWFPVVRYYSFLPQWMEFLRRVRMKDYSAYIEYLYKMTFSSELSCIHHVFCFLAPYMQLGCKSDNWWFFVPWERKICFAWWT